MDDSSTAARPSPGGGRPLKPRSTLPSSSLYDARWSLLPRASASSCSTASSSDSPWSGGGGWGGACRGRCGVGGLRSRCCRCCDWTRGRQPGLGPADGTVLGTHAAAPCPHLLVVVRVPQRLEAKEEEQQRGGVVGVHLGDLWGRRAGGVGRRGRERAVGGAGWWAAWLRAGSRAHGARRGRRARPLPQAAAAACGAAAWPQAAAPAAAPNPGPARAPAPAPPIRAPLPAPSSPPAR
jgi:hypothetical protein